MVPVRFASQAFGANVGWDQASKTVIVIDTPIVTEAMMSDFTYLAQLAELGQLAEGQTQKVVADFTGAIVVEDIEISFAMDILMLMNLKNADGKVDAEFTVPEELGGSMEFSMDMLMDLEGGTYYINSELLNEMFGAGAGTWFRLNLLELATLAGGDIGDIAGLGNLGITTLAGIEDIISESINSFELTSIDDYAMIMDDLALAKEILGDGAFVADGDSRTATISEDGIDITVSVTLENGAVVGYAIDLNIVDEYSGTISLYMAISAGTGSMKLVAEMEGVSMTMELEATYSDTDEAVRTAPPTGAPIVNAVELLTLAMMLAQSNV